MVDTLKTDPVFLSHVDLLEDELDVSRFVEHGSLGYQTLRTMLCAAASVALGRDSLWAYTLSYEDLMKRKSACVGELLHALGWLHFVRSPDILGTVEGDRVFLKDAHSGGGFAKAGGTTIGGDTDHLEGLRKNGVAAESRKNAHLPDWQASI